MFLPSKISAGSMVAKPFQGHTESFITCGSFETEEEATNCQKYLKTKFARALLSTLKVTQDQTPPHWKNVPQQDFTANSDIDWSKSIADIDNQLFKKYNIPPEESIRLKICIADLE